MKPGTKLLRIVAQHQTEWEARRFDAGDIPMNLEKRSNDPECVRDRLEYIHPLETIERSRDTDFDPKVVPTEQGQLLLDFLRRQLFK